jgi:hypothetical protein
MFFFFWNISTIGRRWPISQVHIRHEALGESPGTTGAVRQGDSKMSAENVPVGCIDPELVLEIEKKLNTLW